MARRREVRPERYRRPETMEGRRGARSASGSLDGWPGVCQPWEGGDPSELLCSVDFPGFYHAHWPFVEQPGFYASITKAVM